MLRKRARLGETSSIFDFRLALRSVALYKKIDTRDMYAHLVCNLRYFFRSPTGSNQLKALLYANLKRDSAQNKQNIKFQILSIMPN